MKSLSQEEKAKWMKVVIEDISSGGKVFGTKPGKTFKLDEFDEAYQYARKNATAGKSIFRIQE